MEAAPSRERRRRRRRPWCWSELARGVVVVLAVAAAFVAGEAAFVSSDGAVYMLQEWPEEVFFKLLTRNDTECLVCETLLGEAQFELKNGPFSFFELMETMESACHSPALFNFTHRYVKFIKYRFGWRPPTRHDRVHNYTTDCVDLLSTVGETMAEVVWENWDDWYFHNVLPQRACAVVMGCNATDSEQQELDELIPDMPTPTT